MTFIIAEAGVNHNGDLDLARKLIDAAAAAGADAVKFQTFKAERLVSRHAPKAQYQIETTGASESQFDMIRKLELDEAMHRLLIDHCAGAGIQFLSTPFDEQSADDLLALGITHLKIPSGELTNGPLLQHLGAKNRAVILSTGMATLGEVETALDVLTTAGADDITVLHCNTAYPTPMEDANLHAIQTLALAFPHVEVGYSDHTLGIEAPIAAVALGAVMIEKHFTLDRDMPGPDHRASLEPDELTHMVSAIRNIEQALGDGRKRPQPSEIANIPIARKSIVAATAISAGDIFTRDNLTCKRPGSGISPMRLDELLGRTATRDYQPDQLIQP